MKGKSMLLSNKVALVTGAAGAIGYGICEVLLENGISFEIVPGVTSAIAAPAYAGIPLTHREYTSTVAFVTGHEDPQKKESSIDWSSLAQGIGTLVFFMGVKNLPNIIRQLTTHGKPQDTPAALIRWGTTPRQVA